MSIKFVKKISMALGVLTLGVGSITVPVHAASSSEVYATEKAVPVEYFAGENVKSVVRTVTGGIVAYTNGSMAPGVQDSFTAKFHVTNVDGSELGFQTKVKVNLKDAHGVVISDLEDIDPQGYLKITFHSISDGISFITTGPLDITNPTTGARIGGFSEINIQNAGS